MSSLRNRIFFRADGNSEIGLGHIMRCLALVEMLIENFDCVFITRNLEANIKETIQSFCSIRILNSTDIENEKTELNSILKGTDILVIDGYDFDSEYQKFIKSKVRKLIMIDDNADKQYYADLIINHGNVEMSKKYQLVSNAKILTGPDYLILRKEFLTAAKIHRKIKLIQTAFICFGGADPFGLTINALKACLQTSFISSIIVVTGGAYGSVEELNNIVLKADKNIIHEQNVNASKMVDLLSKCEIAICPASTISLEVCCVKAGLIIGTVADNQNAIHDQITKSGCAITVIDFNSTTVVQLKAALEKINDKDIINNMMMNQTRMIDGLSRERILNEILQLAG